MEQLSLFDFMAQQSEPVVEKKNFDRLKSVGDKIGRVILGECRVATITKVEGNGRFLFYRTDRGVCYSYEDGLCEVEELEKEAEIARENYQTIEPKNLLECFTAEYVSEITGKTLCKQVGIFNGMLFWKDWVTYQFLEPYKSEKELKKAYEKFKKDMLVDAQKGLNKFRILDQEREMRRLYWSKHGFYADAEYVQHNG